MVTLVGENRKDLSETDSHLSTRSVFLPTLQSRAFVAAAATIDGLAPVRGLGVYHLRVLSQKSPCWVCHCYTAQMDCHAALPQQPAVLCGAGRQGLIFLIPNSYLPVFAGVIGPVGLHDTTVSCAASPGEPIPVCERCRAAVYRTTCAACRRRVCKTCGYCWKYCQDCAPPRRVPRRCVVA